MLLWSLPQRRLHFDHPSTTTLFRNSPNNKKVVLSKSEGRQNPSAGNVGRTDSSAIPGPDGRQANSATTSDVGTEAKVEQDGTASGPPSPARNSSKGGKGLKPKAPDLPEKPKLPRKPLDRSRVSQGLVDQKKAAPGQGRYPRP